MIEALLQVDEHLFRAINNSHCTVADWALWCITQHYAWAVVLVLLFVLVCLRYDRPSHPNGQQRHWWIAVLAVVLCFVLADQGSVQLFKNTVCRLRPCHALPDVRMFHTRCGGQYGFVSSHAANAFAILTFIWLRYRKQSVWAVVATAVWAVATSYSRIYLGKHYPLDVVCGAMFGALMGLLVWWLSAWAEKKLQKSETK